MRGRGAEGPSTVTPFARDSHRSAQRIKHARTHPRRGVSAFHSRVPADHGVQVGGAGLVGVEPGDGVEALAALALAGELAPTVDADGEACAGEVDPAVFVGDGAGLDRAGLASAVAGVGGGVLDGDVPPRQGCELAAHGGLVACAGFRLYAMEISPPVSVWICEMRGRYIGGTAGEPSWTRLSISVPPKVTGFIEI